MDDKERYLKWKLEYQKAHKRERLVFLSKILITFLIVASFTFLFYYWYVGELQFISHSTEYTQAEVIDIKLIHLGKGYYMQDVIYEFGYKGTKYEGSFRAGKATGRQEIGNIIKIKFSKRDPDRSLMVAIYK
jgi:hypothetical protein